VPMALAGGVFALLLRGIPSRSRRRWVHRPVGRRRAQRPRHDERDPKAA
jgi:hypothetical protein